MPPPASAALAGRHRPWRECGDVDHGRACPGIRARLGRGLRAARGGHIASAGFARLGRGAGLAARLAGAPQPAGQLSPLNYPGFESFSPAKGLAQARITLPRHCRYRAPFARTARCTCRSRQGRERTAPSRSPAPCRPDDSNLEEALPGLEGNAYRGGADRQAVERRVRGGEDAGAHLETFVVRLKHEIDPAGIAVQPPNAGRGAVAYGRRLLRRRCWLEAGRVGGLGVAGWPVMVENKRRPAQAALARRAWLASAIRR